MATHIAPSAAAAATARTGVHRWAWFTLAFFVVVVLEGAVVRATSSGAGCGNHWPLCNGEVLPHHPRVATIIEFAHRSLTGVSSLCFVVLTAWTFRATGRRHPARRAASVAALLLVTEALLGALLVKNGWVENNSSAARVLMQCVHFTNTMLLLAATTATAVLLGQRRTGIHAPSALESRWSARIALVATLLAGATGSVAALADTIFPSQDLRAALSADFAQHSPMLLRMRILHPVAALLAAACAVWFATHLRRAGRPRIARLLFWNVAAQVVIGGLDVILLAPVTLQLLHLLSADIFWIVLVSAALPLTFSPYTTNGAHIPVLSSGK